MLNDLLALKVPNGLSRRLAALTEPLAVGVHAVGQEPASRSGDAGDRPRAAARSGWP